VKLKEKKLIRKTWPRVREIVVDGQIFYQVDPRRQLDGKPVGGKRETFSSKKKATVRADEIASETILDGRAAANMDPELRLMAIKGQAALEPFGKSLADAVEFYKEYLLLEQAKGNSQNIKTLVELWWKEKFNKKRKALRQATIDDIQETGQLLKKNFGDLKVLEASKKHFEDYLYNLNAGQRRRFNLRSRFSQFFNWCIHEHELPIKNPLEKIVIEVPEKEVPIFTPSEAENLLKLCQKSFPQLLAYHAVSLFGGLRPSEAEFIEWDDVHLEEKQIKVRAEISKTKDTRIFTMHDTLAAWLNSVHGVKFGRILQTSNTRGDFEKFRSELGFKIGKQNPNGKKWPEDILRHSFGTYWLRIYNNKPHLAEIMGNSPSIIKKHYKAIVSESDARKYWAVLP
jgi:integrase